MPVAAVARITVPVDRRHQLPATAVALAATLARQAATAVEFVTAGGEDATTSHEPALRAYCADALAAGAPRASWTMLSGSSDVGAYATWSGSTALCVPARRHRPELAAGGRAVLRSAAIPVLVVGSRTPLAAGGYSRLVVGLDGAHPRGDIASEAVAFARSLGLDVVLTEVVPPTPHGGDVHESAFLHRVADAIGGASSMFDTLHAGKPAEGIVRFVGRDVQAIIAVGAPVAGCRGQVPGGHVARAVIRHATCPVLLVPLPAESPARDGAQRSPLRP